MNLCCKKVKFNPFGANSSRHAAEIREWVIQMQFCTPSREKEGFFSIQNYVVSYQVALISRVF
jgi:hypothetical protein